MPAIYMESKAFAKVLGMESLCGEQRSTMRSGMRERLRMSPSRLQSRNPLVYLILTTCMCSTRQRSIHLWLVPILIG